MILNELLSGGNSAINNLTSAIASYNMHDPTALLYFWGGVTSLSGYFIVIKDDSDIGDSVNIISSSNNKKMNILPSIGAKKGDVYAISCTATYSSGAYTAIRVNVYDLNGNELISKYKTISGNPTTVTIRCLTLEQWASL